jgi:threonine synthase
MPLGVSAYALSPDAMAGIEPLGQELVVALSTAPERVFVPVGGGGLLVATWRGLHAIAGGDGATRAAVPNGTEGATTGARTRLHAVQVEGNDTLVSALHAGETRAREVATPATISGLVVPLDLDATAALHAVRASGGDGHVVEDEHVWQAQAELARHEGLYVEPAGAVSVAGLRQAVEQSQVRPDERVVCLLTGHGYKDAAAAGRMAGRDGSCDVVVSPEEIDATLLDRVPAFGPRQ